MGVLAGRDKGSRRESSRSGRAVRPTAAKVKSAIFNMLPASLLEDGRVLDAYAGTGALGMEALEWGAGWADFIEQDRRLCWGIQARLRDAGLERQGHVHCATVAKALAFLSEPYDVVLLDPPYALSEIDVIMARIAEAGLLRSESMMVVEHAWRSPLPERAGPLELVKRRRYGDTAVSIYVPGGAESGSDA